MNPIEALESLINKGMMWASVRKEKPGDAMRKLTQEEREAIKKLTSDQTRNQRIYR